MELSKINVKINNVEYTANASSTILEIINQNEVPHPQICYVPEVDPFKHVTHVLWRSTGNLYAHVQRLL